MKIKLDKLGISKLEFSLNFFKKERKKFDVMIVAPDDIFELEEIIDVFRKKQKYQVRF